MLKTRVITAAVLLSGLLAALFFLPPLLWAVFCALVCALAAWEWGGLAGWGRKARAVYGVALGCLCCLAAALFDHRAWFLLLFVSGLFWLLIVPFWLWRKWPLCFHPWSAALTGIIVLIPPTLVFIVLRNMEPWALLAACALAWVADIAAYFSGRAFGGKKLAPNISPGKTWAGAVGGVIGVLVYCNIVFLVFFVTKFDRPGFEIQHVLPLQLAIIGLAVWSIIGDLFESLLKRQAGMKDSSNLLPGHGGILDRIDSLTSVLPLLLLFLFLYFPPFSLFLSSLGFFIN
jgi:phosphatidate cytidylyltransferase